MRWFAYYLMGREVNGIVLLFFLGFLSLAATGAADSGARNSAEQEKCYEAFAAQGLSEKDVWKVSEREVLQTCGSIPTFRINKVWHIERRDQMREQGIGKAGELLNCYDAFEAKGVTVEEVADVSKERFIEVCGIVPALLR